MSSYPSSIASINQPGSATNMDDSGYEHDSIHDQEIQEIEAIETEIGTNPKSIDDTVTPASTPTSVANFLDMVGNLIKQIGGQSHWYTAIPISLATHIAATVAHGVTGNVVGDSDVQTLTNKTINASQLVDNSIKGSKLSTSTDFGNSSKVLLNFVPRKRTTNTYDGNFTAGSWKTADVSSIVGSTAVAVMLNVVYDVNNTSARIMLADGDVGFSTSGTSPDESSGDARIQGFKSANRGASDAENRTIVVRLDSSQQFLYQIDTVTGTLTLGAYAVLGWWEPAGV